MPRYLLCGCPFFECVSLVKLHMENFIHMSQLPGLVASGEFSLRFVSKKGEVIAIEKCICTSYHSAGHTMNIKVCSSGEIRKINRFSIVALNNKEVVF